MNEDQFVKVSFREAFRFLARGLVPALLIAAAGAAITYFVVKDPVPLYRASAILLATRPSSGYSSSVDVLEPVQVDPAVYRSAVFQGGLLEGALTEVLGTVQTPDEIADWRRRVRVRVDENLISGLVRIEVDDHDQAVAVSVANAVADSLLTWDRGRVDRNIQSTLTALSRSVVLLTAQITTAEQAKDDATARALRTTRDQRLSQLRAAETLSLSAVVMGLLEPFREAVPDLKPVNDRTLFYTAVVFVALFLLSYVVAFFLQVTDPRVRSEEDVAKVSGLGLWAMIPRQARGAAFSEALARLTVAMPVPEPVAALQPDRGGQGRLVLVTAPDKAGEHSILARHLALAYAKAGWRVLVVDADMKDGVISASTTLPREAPTLVDLLRSEAEHAKPGTITNGAGVQLDIVPAGAVPYDGSAPLLKRRFSRLVAAWRAAYQIIIVDSTSLTEGAGTLAIVPEADAVVLTTRRGTTRLSSLRAAAEQLAQACARNKVGVVLVDGSLATGRSPVGRQPSGLEQLPGAPGLGSPTARAQVIRRTGQ